MPIDPSIALGVRVPQMDSPLASYANALSIQNMGNQNRLAQLQYENALQAQSDDKEYRSAVMGSGGDLAAVKNALMAKGLVKQAMSVDEAMRKREKETTDIDKDKLDMALKKANAFGAAIAPLALSPNPTHEEVMTVGKRLQAQGILGSGWEAQIPMNALELPKFVRGLAVQNEQGRKALEMLIPKVELRDTGGSIVPMNTNPLAGTPGAQVGVATKKAVGPDAILSATTTRRGQDLTDQRQRDQNDLLGGRNTREDIDNLRKEFEGKQSVKDYRQAIPVAEAARKAPDTRAGDIQLAYAVGKVLDPNSVVREGELKLVGAAATLPQRVQGELRTLVDGEGRLTPKTRKELQTMLDSAVGERGTAYEAEKRGFESIVKRRGYNPQDVFLPTPATGGWSIKVVN